MKGSFSKFENKVPLVVVPSTYNTITEDELIKAGVNIVIYANHLLRSAYPAMVKTAESILTNQRSYEANEFCLPIKEVLTLIPGVNRPLNSRVLINNIYIPENDKT